MLSGRVEKDSKEERKMVACILSLCGAYVPCFGFGFRKSAEISPSDMDK